MAYDVFISYSHKDKTTADAIVNHFESEGMRCWYAPRDIQPGREWAESIMEALKAVRMVVLIFTDYANASIQVRREVDNAISSGITILPFKLTESVPSGGMEYYLSTLHWLDAMSMPLENAIDELTVMAKAVLSGEAVLSPNRPGQASVQAEEATPADKLKRGVRGMGRVLLMAAFALVGGIFGVYYLINPGFWNDVQLVCLWIALACLAFVAYKILTWKDRPKRNKRIRLFFWLFEALILAGMAGGMSLISKSTPAFTMGEVTDEQAANQVNYSIAARSADGETVYYTTQNEILTSSLADFYAGKRGERIYTGFAEYLTLAGDDQLVFRDENKHMKRLDLDTGDVKTLDRADTEHYFGTDGWVLYGSYTDSIIHRITTEGTHTTDLANGTNLSVYDGRIYFIANQGGLYSSGQLHALDAELTPVSDMVNAYYVIQEEYVYFSDGDTALSGVYRFPLTDPGQVEKLATDSASQMLVYEGMLYYINQSDAGSLYALNLNTLEAQLASRNRYTALNRVGDCLYLCTGNLSYEQIMLK